MDSKQQQYENKIVLNSKDIILNKGEISDLNKIDKKWKEILSDDYSLSTAFHLDGYSWKSFSHYYQANKYKNDKKYYYKFTVESDDNLSKDLSLIDKTKTVDYNFYNILDGENDIPNNIKVTRKGLMAKFNQNSHLKKVLLATYNAELWKASNEGVYFRLSDLELIRDYLKRKS